MRFSVYVDDSLSGIDAKETSFDLKLNETVLYPAYQPIKKIVSYNFDQPLQEGSHKIDFEVRDRMGN